MTVKELISELQELPQDLDVLQSKDSEGNEFSYTWKAQLEKVDENYYVYAPEDYADYLDELTDVVVLWP